MQLTVNNDADGKKIIQHLRTLVKAHNLVERSKETLDPDYSGKFKRVDLYGRLGKNNPNRHKYSKGGEKANRFGGATRISLDDAAHVSIYVNNICRTSYGDWKGFRLA
jgi:hypothetical protein